MFTGNTETRIAATYEDGDGTIDLVVTDMTADTQLTTEAVQDIVGGMLTGNTETRIAVSYEDGDGTIDFVVDDMSGGGISHDGSTADGVLTYKDADEATVEANLTFDGNSLSVTTGSASAVPLTIQGASSQSVNLLLIEKSDGTDYIAVDNNGTIRLGPSGTNRIQTDNSSGTNTAGRLLDFRGGKGTGNAAGGNIEFRVSPAGSSGSTANAHAQALVIDSAKVLDFKIGATDNAAGVYGNPQEVGGDNKVLKIKVGGTDYFVPLYVDISGGP